MKIIILASSILLFCANMVNAQGAIPFLNLNADPYSQAIGWGGPTNVSAAPFGYYFNPSLLGYYAQKTNAGFQTYTTVPNWLGMKVRLNQNTFMLGYSFKNVAKNLNINTGFGYSHSRMDYGTYTMGPYEYIHPYDKYDAYSFGIMLDYYIGVSFGISIKKTDSNLGAVNEEGNPDYAKTSVTAKDWGILLSVPVSKLIFGNPVFMQNDLAFKPYLDFSLGYSKSNLGDDVYYIDPAQSEPLDRMARLGYNLSFGTYVNLFDTQLKLVDINFIITSEDRLVEAVFLYSQNGTPYNYKVKKDEGLGKFNIIQNLIIWRPTGDLNIRKGRSISFFETITLMGGSFAGESYFHSPSTNGYAVSSEGLFKILSASKENSDFTKFLFDHIEFKYVSASIFIDHEFNSTLTSASVSIKNFHF